MSRRGRRHAAGSLLLLAPMAWALSGCSVPGTINGTAASTPTTRHASTRVDSAAGTWVFRNASTVETLHLKQGKGGKVTGSGNSTVKATSGRVGHFQIDVHTGSVKKGVLSLSLYVTRTDTSTSGLTIVEYLRCSLSSRTLHCRMNAPLYPSARNVPQDFVRRA